MEEQQIVAQQIVARYENLVVVNLLNEACALKVVSGLIVSLSKANAGKLLVVTYTGPKCVAEKDRYHVLGLLVAALTGVNTGVVSIDFEDDCENHKFPKQIEKGDYPFVLAANIYPRVKEGTVLKTLVLTDAKEKEEAAAESEEATAAKEE